MMLTREQAYQKAKEICDRWTEDGCVAANLYESIAIALIEAGRPFKMERFAEDIYDLRIDRRAQRAHSLTAFLMKAIEPHICDHVGDHHRNASRKLDEFFYQNGFDVVTDQDRAEMGLPKRDVLGWTTTELHIRELAINEAMLKPIAVIKDVK